MPDHHTSISPAVAAGARSKRTEQAVRYSRLQSLIQARKAQGDTTVTIRIADLERVMGILATGDAGLKVAS